MERVYSLMKNDISRRENLLSPQVQKLVCLLSIRIPYEDTGYSPRLQLGSISLKCRSIT